MIKVEELEKVYGYGRNALKVLKGVSLDIKKGEIVSVVGPSGAGKSTLLNMIGCLDGFQSGGVAILGKDISNLDVESLAGLRNRHVGFIFQLHNLLNEFTALENVMIPLLIQRMKKREAKERAMELIESFNLQDRAYHKPMELSGGECQRIAVARALVVNPDIILADEPTGNLDSENSRLLIDTLLKLAKENETTIIIITHDKDIAGLTERTITLVDGVIKSDVAK
ncbi:MAG: ABC transporter ATP-binding protein [bacterium]|nr:ABC transporter ATP-binding protein [bacterium]